jgi:hypothetical protein
MRISILLLSIFIINSCNGQEKKQNKEKNTTKTQNNMIEKELDINIIKNLLENQKNVVTEENEPEEPYNLSKKDFEIAEKIIVKGLKNSGYKFPNQEEFNKKVNEIFRIDKIKDCPRIDIENNEITIYGKAMDGQKSTLRDNKFEPYSISENLFILPSEKIIMQMFLLKDLIIIKEGNYIINIPHFIIARNKYLFNNSQGDFVWLQFNDEYFLESLVKTFGYTSDKKLLDWYIKRNDIQKYKNSIEEYLKVFYIKTCDNQLIIHKETFDLMDSNPEKYSKEIQEVLDAIRLGEIQLENLNFTEKAKIVAYLLYFGEKHKEKTQMYFKFMGMFYEHSSEDEKKKYDVEFKKNNYYNLPNFQKLWEEAKINGDGIGLDM